MSERLYSKFDSVGTLAHVNVQDPNDELELGKPFETECLANRCFKMFGKPCDLVQCVLEGRMHIRNVLQTLDIQCIQQVTYAMSTTTPFAVIVDNTCLQTQGVNCRLDETRDKWP